MDAILIQISNLVANLTTGVASNGAYDFLKTRLGNVAQPRSNDIEAALSDFLCLKGISAETKSKILLETRSGILSVQQSDLRASEMFTIRATGPSPFVVGDNTTIATNKAGIVAGAGAHMTGQNAGMHIDENGNISFVTFGR